MCLCYHIEFVHPPCTGECTGFVTPRVRRCKQPGAPSCLKVTHTLELMYCCPVHLEKQVFSHIGTFTEAVENGDKFEALHETVKPHLSQFGYSASYVSSKLHAHVLFILGQMN